MPRTGIPGDVPEGICEHCGNHPATMHYTSCSLEELNHGGSYEEWCDCCYWAMSLAWSEQEIARLREHVVECRNRLQTACTTGG